MAPRLDEHGIRSRYNRGCRCEPCVQANRWYAAQWRYNWRKRGGRFNNGYLIRPEEDTNGHIA